MDDERLGEAIIRSRGEITIPVKLRKYLNLKQGEKIIFIRDKKGQTVVKKVKITYEDFDTNEERSTKE